VTNATNYNFFAQLGFNEADTLKSSSILIYYWPEQGVFTQCEWHDAVVIKSEIKSEIESRKSEIN
jgi:hypothetical protein